MRRVIRSTSFIVLAVMALVASGCKTTCPPAADIAEANSNWTKETESLLRQAADRLGVPVQTQPMVHYAQWGAAFYTAPAANFEKAAASELANGVNLGVAYVDSPGQSYPKGFYSLRASAKDPRPGSVEGKIEIINTDGRVAAELPATFEIAPTNAIARPNSPAVDISVAALPCPLTTTGATLVNCRHRTIYANQAFRASTTGLVVPPPVLTGNQ